MKRLLAVLITLLMLLALTACELKEGYQAEAPADDAAASKEALQKMSEPGEPLSQEEAWQTMDAKFAMAENVAPFADRVIGEDAGENYVYSPLSTWLCYEFLLGGLKGDAKSQLQAELEAKTPLDEAKKLAAIRDLSQRLTQEGGAINVQNYLFYDNTRKVQDPFLDYAKNFNAGVYAMDLNRNADVTDAINQLIDRETGGLIKDFYAEPISPKTISILMNIVAFNAKWQEPFDSKQTEDLPFHLADGTTVDVPMMQKDDLVGCEYFEDDIAQYLKLYYESRDYLILMLPKDGVTPEAAIEKWEQYAPGQVEFLQPEVHLKLPKFALESEWQLKDRLSALGLGYLFEGAPGMDGILDGSDFYIADSKQKAKIEVFEEGTKAAAVTDIAKNESMMLRPEEPVDLVFDRPFAFVLNTPDGNLELFRGVVYNPLAENE